MRKWCSCKSCLKLLILWARSVWCWSLTLYDVSDIHCVQHTSACRAYMRCVDWWAASAAAVTHSSRGRVVRANEQAKLPLSGHGERGDQWARRYSSQYATYYCKHKSHCDIISSATANLAQTEKQVFAMLLTCWFMFSSSSTRRLVYCRGRWL